MKKKVLSVILAAVCTMGLMAGCGAEGSKGSTQSGSKGDSYTVGISQFAEHGSLDNCRGGFLELSLIHISAPTRLLSSSYTVNC